MPPEGRGCCGGQGALGVQSPTCPQQGSLPLPAQGLKGVGVPGLRLDSALHQGLLGIQCCASLAAALPVLAAAMPGGDMALLRHGGFSVENVFLEGYCGEGGRQPGAAGPGAAAVRRQPQG